MIFKSGTLLIVSCIYWIAGCGGGRKVSVQHTTEGLQIEPLAAGFEVKLVSSNEDTPSLGSELVFKNTDFVVSGNELIHKNPIVLKKGQSHFLVWKDQWLNYKIIESSVSLKVLDPSGRWQLNGLPAKASYDPEKGIWYFRIDPLVSFFMEDLNWVSIQLLFEPGTRRMLSLGMHLVDQEPVIQIQEEPKPEVLSMKTIGTSLLGDGVEIYRETITNPFWKKQTIAWSGKIESRLKITAQEQSHDEMGGKVIGAVQNTVLERTFTDNTLQMMVRSNLTDIRPLPFLVGLQDSLEILPHEVLEISYRVRIAIPQILDWIEPKTERHSQKRGVYAWFVKFDEVQWDTVRVRVPLRFELSYQGERSFIGDLSGTIDLSGRLQ